ncbi:pseudouridylate synthase RPUSD2-like [Panonychus citri]|uniref:pseudouridylate synthase RPUSD2-like n=1 Tax=Panonychus citri TaxID=50023 RepID=UPI002307827D|nr:pseudouridylate synthase RPUSD2-like [Panonychus citri]
MRIELITQIGLIRRMSSFSGVKRKFDVIEPPATISKTKKRKNILEIDRGDSDYYFEHGLRKVYPYLYTFYSFCKGRWIGSKIVDVYQKEFRSINNGSLLERFSKGLIRVDDEPVSPDYILKDNDLITGLVHRHEMPVIGLPLKIVHEDENILVLDKPPSIPVHSCGRFHLNSVSSILKKEHGIEQLHICHRLDRLTSGLVITSKNRFWARKVIDQITQRLVKKEYIAKVTGQFPEDEITCSKPLGTLDHKTGLQIVDEKNGKESKTVFKRISTDGKTSLVQCEPLTGRTHQIRVHLQYLGYPIANDPLYNCDSFGPNIGKGGDYGEGTLQDLAQRVIDKHRHLHVFESDDYQQMETLTQEELDKRHEEINQLSDLVNKTISDEWREHMKSKSKDSSKLSIDENCSDCKSQEINPLPSELLIYLHCVSYKGIDFHFQTELPFWARD